jgi:hypothetical protein
MMTDSTSATQPAAVRIAVFGASGDVGRRCRNRHRRRSPGFLGVATLLLDQVTDIRFLRAAPAISN